MINERISGHQSKAENPRPWGKHSFAAVAARSLSASQPGLSNSGQSVAAGAVANPGSFSVAIQTMDSGDNAASGGRAVATPHTQRSSFPGMGRDLPSSTRPPLSLGLRRWNLNAAGLPLEVVDTIQNARSSSTRLLYSGKARVFEEWCNDRGTMPFQCSVVEVLCFLQKLLDKGRVFFFHNQGLPGDFSLSCHIFVYFYRLNVVQQSLSHAVLEAGTANLV